MRLFLTAKLLLLLITGLPAIAAADPCGMVPPISSGQAVPLARMGEQQTSLVSRDGIETFVIRPGFRGKVDEFGMLIPFPTPPAIRKVPDSVFPQIAAAVDPPEVVVDLRPVMLFARGAVSKSAVRRQGLSVTRQTKDSVRVIRQEAVGMYEVAVLEAGSAAALKKWMKQHSYRFPAGMEKVCGEYFVQLRWFVAVMAKVGS